MKITFERHPNLWLRTAIRRTFLRCLGRRWLSTRQRRCLDLATAAQFGVMALDARQRRVPLNEEEKAAYLHCSAERDAALALLGITFNPYRARAH